MVSPESGRAADGGGVSGWLRCGEGFVSLEVIVRPGSSQQGIVRQDARGLVIGVNSPPEKGKANEELIDFLARMLRLKKSSIRITRGETGRHKTVRIAAIEPHKVVSTIVRALL